MMRLSKNGIQETPGTLRAYFGVLKESPRHHLALLVALCIFPRGVFYLTSLQAEEFEFNGRSWVQLYILSLFECLLLSKFLPGNPTPFSKAWSLIVSSLFAFLNLLNLNLLSVSTALALVAWRHFRLSEEHLFGSLVVVPSVFLVSVLLYVFVLLLSFSLKAALLSSTRWSFPTDLRRFVNILCQERLYNLFCLTPFVLSLVYFNQGSPSLIPGPHPPLIKASEMKIFFDLFLVPSLVFAAILLEGFAVVRVRRIIDLRS